MSKLVHVTSNSSMKTLLNQNTYVIVDFYADWCGPCKVIAPIYEQLAASETKPGRIAFAKVNVDSAQDVAREYGITAMPTFLIIKNGSVINTIKGANAAALRTAIMAASADAAKLPAKSGSGGASGAAFTSGGGRVLGTGGAPAASGGSMLDRLGIKLGGGSTGGGSTGGSGANGSVSVPGGLAGTVVRFVGLYLTTLLSFDAYKAAEASPLAVRQAAR